LNKKKVKELKKRVKLIQIQWLKSMMTKEEGNKITLDNVDSMLPKETHVHTTGRTNLSFMTDKWLLKKLKRNPNIKNYNQLKEEIKDANIYM
tara:strand:+ start:333 stop:608 length:276 start_codon:yes stop_codon:yes gene_type:complete